MSDREAKQFQEIFNVSRETIERLDAYRALLERWNARMNLVSKQSITEFWTRHAADSAQIAQICRGGTGNWVDLGSGGGFPAVVLAVIFAGESREIQMTMVESDMRKASFLRAALRETGVPGRVEAQRIEKLAPMNADFISARALAPLHKLVGYAKRHGAPAGKAFFLKGAKAEEEIKEALVSWRFDVEKFPSKTDPAALVLKIGGIARE